MLCDIIERALLGGRKTALSASGLLTVRGWRVDQLCGLGRFILERFLYAMASLSFDFFSCQKALQGFPRSIPTVLVSLTVLLIQAPLNLL